MIFFRLQIKSWQIIKAGVQLARYSFPKDFFWGASTAAHQTEGNNIASDWWAYEQAGAKHVEALSLDACDSYNRFNEDIDLLARAGLNTYRFGIEWARIEPEEGIFSKAQILHYRQMIESCLSHNVTPMITLHHFSAPLWFTTRGGWKRTDAADLFLRYVAHLLGLLNGVTWVCTINEPNLLALARVRFEKGAFANTRRNTPDSSISANLAHAHRLVRQLLSAELPHIKSGWSIACLDCQPAPGYEKSIDAYVDSREDFFTKVGAGNDFIGVQAYSRTFVDENGAVPCPPAARHTLTGWEYYPAALGEAVHHVWKISEHTPIFVTENGIATSDDAERIEYTASALAGLSQEMTHGVNVLGYLHWSLLDNYEWGSYSPTFGLVGYDKHTFERRPKPSLAWLGSVARQQNQTAALPSSASTI